MFLCLYSHNYCEYYDFRRRVECLDNELINIVTCIVTAQSIGYIIFLFIKLDELCEYNDAIKQLEGRYNLIPFFYLFCECVFIVNFFWKRKSHKIAIEIIEEEEELDGTAWVLWKQSSHAITKRKKKKISKSFCGVCFPSRMSEKLVPFQSSSPRKY